MYIACTWDSFLNFWLVKQQFSQVKFSNAALLLMNSSSKVRFTQLWSLISLCGGIDISPMSDSLSASVQVGCENYPCLKLSVSNLFFSIEPVLLTSFNHIPIHTENFLWINCGEKTSCVFDSDFNHGKLLFFFQIHKLQFYSTAGTSLSYKKPHAGLSFYTFFLPCVSEKKDKIMQF